MSFDSFPLTHMTDAELEESQRALDRALALHDYVDGDMTHPAWYDPTHPAWDAASQAAQQNAMLPVNQVPSYTPVTSNTTPTPSGMQAPGPLIGFNTTTNAAPGPQIQQYQQALAPPTQQPQQAPGPQPQQHQQAPRPKRSNRPGPLDGWSGPIRQHRRYCVDPHRGCLPTCTLEERCPARYAQVKNRPLRKKYRQRVHSWPKHLQVELWKHCVPEAPTA